MDELNAHHFWGISPSLDLLAAAAAAAQPTKHAHVPTEPIACLQICPYDCRHTLATICGHYQSNLKTAEENPTAASMTPTSAPATTPAAALASAARGRQLQLYIFESEPEILARHMLLLSVLLDGHLTVKERAETFLELHGNVMLRQKTADYLVTRSKWLEDAVVQLSMRPAAAAAAPQQQQQGSDLGVLSAFDLSLLRYQDRDALLETFQRYRQKASYNMAAAWDGRLRKWYGDRYDFRTNLIDWDYHMRLSPRGTPFMDPALGSIVHFYHFRHWRFTGVAHELRESSYVAANTSLLSTAYGRTKEFKNRQLHDVGRSVSAYGYWGDVLNSPFHAFGTVADDPLLFKVANKQFTHTALDVAEHNVMQMINTLQRKASEDAQQATGEAASTADSRGNGREGPPSADQVDHAGHRARAARGPTSLQMLAAAEQQPEQPEQPEQPQQEDDTTCRLNNSAASSESDNGPEGQHQCIQKDVAAAAGKTVQQQIAAATVKQLLPPSDARSSAATVKQLLQPGDANSSAAAVAQQLAQAAEASWHLASSVRIFLLTGDLKKCVTGKQKYAGTFAAATVGHRHVHMLGADYEVKRVMQPGAPVLVETGHNMVQLNAEQVAAFGDKVLELAAAGGFGKHPSLQVQPAQAADTSSDVSKDAGDKHHRQHNGMCADDAPGSSKCWKLPSAHLPLTCNGVPHQGV